MGAENWADGNLIPVPGCPLYFRPGQMADEDIFAAAERRENPNRSQRAKQWMTSVSSMFSKCVPTESFQKMKARFNKAGQPQEGSQALVDNDYHEFPEMNQTSTAAHSQAAFRPPSIPDRNIAVPYPSPPAEKLSSPGDDEWAENLAKRAITVITVVSSRLPGRACDWPTRRTAAVPPMAS